ncbi:MAG: hypothetical protein JNN26_03930 [Candidatus Obscuribacter sp.]|nr:hypothetical protein [Candidatus Obscuribacter sp.]
MEKRPQEESSTKNKWKPLQYLAASGLVPILSALHEPSYLPPLLYTLFVAVYLYHSLKPPEKAEKAVPPLWLALHFCFLFTACGITACYLSRIINQTALVVMVVYFLTQALCFLFLRSCFPLRLWQVFLLMTISDPLMPLEGKFLAQAPTFTMDTLGRLVNLIMTAGAVAGLPLTVLAEPLKSFERGGTEKSTFKRIFLPALAALSVIVAPKVVALFTLGELYR